MIPNVLSQHEELLNCKCSTCGHSDRSICINEKCYCCNLEDMFSIL